jgi:hypothetical protein
MNYWMDGWMGRALYRHLLSKGNFEGIIALKPSTRFLPKATFKDRSQYFVKMKHQKQVIFVRFSTPVGIFLSCVNII